MEITKKNLIDLIRQISGAVDQIQAELILVKRENEELKQQNERLKENNLATLDQIREYLKELEQIRTHYVDNKNKSWR